MIILIAINRQYEKLKSHIDSLDEPRKAIIYSGVYDVRHKLRIVEFNLNQLKDEASYKSFIPFTNIFLCRWRCAKNLNVIRTLIKDVENLSKYKKQSPNVNVEYFQKHIEEQNETYPSYPFVYPSPIGLKEKPQDSNQEEKIEQHDEKHQFIKINLN